jgi:hypothetical protein
MGRSECPFRARAAAPGRAPAMIGSRASRTARTRSGGIADSPKLPGGTRRRHARGF